MEIFTLIINIIEVCIIPLLGLLTKALIDYIKTKTNNQKFDKYILLLNNTISNCVLATKQTYVETLKNKGNFDAEAQEEAFSRTKDAVMAILTEDAKIYLSTIYSDLDSYINQKIESEVNLTK